jgi:hypothetical protein
MPGSIRESDTVKKPLFKQFKTFKPFKSAERREAVELSEAIEPPPPLSSPATRGRMKEGV